MPGIDQDKVKENTAATTIYLLVIILLQKRSLLNVQFVQKSFPTEVTCQFTFQLFMKVKKTFECDTCGNRFKEKSKLKIHISSVHERNRPFECEICQMSFAEKRNLIRHIASVHEKKRPFKCDSCPKTFARKEKLNAHINITKCPSLKETN